MSFPLFPDVCFPNQVTIRLCADAVGIEGGANPVPATPGVTLPASVQDREVMWDAGRHASVTRYRVSFQADPTAALARAILPGDECEVFEGVVTTIIAPPRNAGGFGFLWWMDCDHVKQ